MADKSHEICERTDALDAAGITTIVVGKVIFFQFYFLIKLEQYFISSTLSQLEDVSIDN